MLLTRQGAGSVRGRHPRPTVTTATTTATAVALAAFVTSCSSGAAPAPTATDLGSLRRAAPITAAVYDLKDIDVAVGAASAKLITACMRAKGFTYRGTSAVEVGDEDVPRVFGYEEPPATRAAARRPVREAPQSAAYALALGGRESDRVNVVGDNGMVIGLPGSGCAADAEKQLLGDQRERHTQLRLVLADLERAAAARLARDHAFRDANERWSDCMEGKGWRYNAPTELLQAVARDPDAGRRADVRADLACKQSTGYLAIGYQRLAALQQEALDAQPGVLAEWRALLEREKQAARAVLTGDRP